MTLGRRGFGLFQLVGALLLLAGPVTVLLWSLGDVEAADREREDRADAATVARNELELQRALGPWELPALTGRVVNRAGEPDPNGPLRLRIERQTRCSATPVPPDNALAAPHPSGCGSTGRGARSEIRVVVVFPEGQDSGRVEAGVTLTDPAAVRFP